MIRTQTRRWRPSPCNVNGFFSIASWMNRGTSLSGNWLGPYTLLHRGIVIGNPYALQYTSHSNSADALEALYLLIETIGPSQRAHGLVGAKSAFSSQPDVLISITASPYTSSVLM